MVQKQLRVVEIGLMQAERKRLGGGVFPQAGQIAAQMIAAANSGFNAVSMRFQCGLNQRPSAEALALRYEEFRRRLRSQRQ